MLLAGSNLDFINEIISVVDGVALLLKEHIYKLGVISEPAQLLDVQVAPVGKKNACFQL